MVKEGSLERVDASLPPRKPISISDDRDRETVELIRAATRKLLAANQSHAKIHPDRMQGTGSQAPKEPQKDPQENHSNDHLNTALSKSLEFLDSDSPTLAKTVQLLASSTSNTLEKELAGASLFADDAVEIIRAATMAAAASTRKKRVDSFMSTVSENKEEDEIVSIKTKDPESVKEGRVVEKSAYEVVQDRDAESVVFSVSRTQEDSIVEEKAAYQHAQEHDDAEEESVALSAQRSPAEDPIEEKSVYQTVQDAVSVILSVAEVTDMVKGSSGDLQSQTDDESAILSNPHVKVDPGEEKSVYDVVQDAVSVILSVTSGPPETAGMNKESSSACSTSVTDSTDLSSAAFESQESNLDACATRNSIETPLKTRSDATGNSSGDEETIIVDLIVDDEDDGPIHGNGVTRVTSNTLNNSNAILSRAEDIMNKSKQTSGNKQRRQKIFSQRKKKPPNPARQSCIRKTGDVFVVSNTPPTKNRRGGRFFGIAFGKRRNRSGLSSSVDSQQPVEPTQNGQTQKTPKERRSKRKTEKSAVNKANVSVQGSQAPGSQSVARSVAGSSSQKWGIRSIAGSYQKLAAGSSAKLSEKENPAPLEYQGRSSRIARLGGMEFEESIQDTTENLDGLDFSEAYSLVSEDESRDDGITLEPVISFGTQDMMGSSSMPNGFCHVTSLDGRSVWLRKRVISDFSHPEEANNCTPNFFFINSEEEEKNRDEDDDPDESSTHYVSSYYPEESEHEEEGGDEDGHCEDGDADDIFHSMAKELDVGKFFGSKNRPSRQAFEEARLRTQSNGLNSIYSGRDDSVMSAPDDPFQVFSSSYQF